MCAYRPVRSDIAGATSLNGSSAACVPARRTTAPHDHPGRHTNPVFAGEGLAAPSGVCGDAHGDIVAVGELAQRTRIFRRCRRKTQRGSCAERASNRFGPIKHAGSCGCEENVRRHSRLGSPRGSLQGACEAIPRFFPWCRPWFFRAFSVRLPWGFP